MARAGRDAPFDCSEGLNGAAGPESGAVQRGGGAGKLELARRRPALQQRVDESSVKDIARSGRVERFHLKCRRVVELRAVPGKNAFVSKCGGGKPASKALENKRERLAEVVLVGEPARDVAADDEIVDPGQQGIDGGVELVEIGDYGNVRSASPSRSSDGCGGVVTIHEKSASGSDPLRAKFLGLEREARISPPENGAFAGRVNEDESLLAGAGCGEELRFDTEAGEFGAVDPGSFVIAEFSDVPGAKAPGLAGDHRRGDLASWQHRGGFKGDLRAAFGIVRKRDERIGSVQADANDIHVG